MTAYYRNRETGIVQAHPQSGIGESLNSDEIEDNGKPVKPRTSLAPTKDELKKRSALAKGPKTTEAKTGTGESKKQEGAE